MRTRTLVPDLFLSLAAASFSAQRQGFTINPAMPEGRLLQQVGQVVRPREKDRVDGRVPGAISQA